MANSIVSKSYLCSSIAACIAFATSSGGFAKAPHPKAPKIITSDFALLAILWKFVFFSGYGFLNKILIGLGLVSKPVQFLGSRWLLLLVVSIVVVWRSVPFMALVCLAGRQSIPDAIYEAAKMDGGTPRKVFWHITMPLMKPFLALGITSTSVTAINVFDEIVALSGYGDLGKNILMESYLTTFSFLNFGKGSAMTYIVLFFALLLGIFYLRNLNKEVDY